MQLCRQEPLLGHGVQVAVQAVDDDDLCAVRRSTALADELRELAGRELGRIDLLRSMIWPGAAMPSRDPCPSPSARARSDRARSRRRRRCAGVLAACRRPRGVLQRDRRLAAARPARRAACSCRARARRRAARRARRRRSRSLLRVEVDVGARRDQPREDLRARRVRITKSW